MGLLDLLTASSIPVLKVLIITALGSFLALERVDILGEIARKHVNKVVFYVFNPALVASNLAETVTYDDLRKMWFMPFNILITYVIGSFLGWIVIQMAKPPSHLRGLVVGCCAAGNMGNMFLIMIPAVCKEKGSPFGAPAVCQSYGLAYVSLSMAIGAIFLWSYVYNIVRSSSKRSKSIHVSRSPRAITASEQDTNKEPLLPNSGELQASEDLEDQHAGTNTRERSETGFSLKRQLTVLLGSINWKALLAPSTLAVFVGFTVGLNPTIRQLMIGEDAPLHVIQDSAALLGDGAIPTLTLIVGGNLLKGLQGSRTQKSLVLGIVIVRYIFLPVIGIFIVQGALHLGFIPPDPLYQFVLLLQYAVPPAMNIGTITQHFGAGETECSVIMLNAYALASISLTLWSTFFMWRVAS